MVYRFLKMSASRFDWASIIALTDTYISVLRRIVDIIKDNGKPTELRDANCFRQLRVQDLDSYRIRRKMLAAQEAKQGKD